jgi:hypothetical protein
VLSPDPCLRLPSTAFRPPYRSPGNRRVDYSVGAPREAFRLRYRARCQQNLVMLEVDVFTASEKRLRDLVVSFSGLR